MKQLHLTLDENSPAMQWANSQAEKVQARGHVGTHLDCYTTVPPQSQYRIRAIVMDCRNSMPDESLCDQLPALEGMVLVLRTGNLTDNGYGSDAYFDQPTYLSEKALMHILSRKPLFILIDSHGIAPKGERHIQFDKTCEAAGCHVIENADLTPLSDNPTAQIGLSVNIGHPSTGKPCEIYLL